MSEPDLTTGGERLVGTVGMLVVAGVLACLLAVVVRVEQVGFTDARRFARATNDLRAGRNEAARAGFTAAAQANPGNPYGHFYLYCTYVALKDLQRGLPALQDALTAGLPALWVAEPRCREDRHIASGFITVGPEAILVRLADPEAPYVAGRPVREDRVPPDAEAQTLVCWNDEMGLRPLAERQAEILGVESPQTGCPTP